jgi:hypothetical protein
MIVGANFRARLLAIDPTLKRRARYFKYARSFANSWNFAILEGFDCKLDSTLLIDRILGILAANRGHGG